MYQTKHFSGKIIFTTFATMLHNLRVCFSVLLLVVCAFPALEKGLHELEHIDEVHCQINEAHFCEFEHNCSLCDFVFSTSFPPIKSHFQITVNQKVIDPVVAEVQLSKTTSPSYTFSLRGPPVG